MNIHKSIIAVLREAGAIGKNRKNQQQGYTFRGIDDVYNELNPLLGKHGVFSVPEVLEERREERPTKSGGILTSTILKIKYTFYADDGSSLFAVVIGEGMDSGDKSANKAMSVGHKYALLQVFSIPTEDHKDPEHESPEPAARQPTKQEAPNGEPGINRDEARAIHDAAKAAGLTDAAVLQQFAIIRYSALPSSRYRDAMSWIAGHQKVPPAAVSAPVPMGGPPHVSTSAVAHPRITGFQEAALQTTLEQLGVLDQFLNTYKINAVADLPAIWLADANEWIAAHPANRQEPSEVPF